MSGALILLVYITHDLPDEVPVRSSNDSSSVGDEDIYRTTTTDYT